MRKVTLLLLVSLFSLIGANAQNHSNGIGVHFTGIDFYGPQTGSYFFQDKINPSTLKTQSKLFWDPSIRVSFWHSLNKHFDLVAALNVSALQYPNSEKDSNYIKAKQGMNSLRNDVPYASADVKVNYNILPRFDYLFSPYLTAGINGSIRESLKGFNLPAGLGLNINLGKGVLLNLESNYLVSLSKNTENHLTHSVGMVYFWQHAKKAPVVKTPPPPPPPVVKDADNDGIPDAEDACPTMAGKREMKGCPDRDNDGIADNEDLCPEVKGIRQFNGCPDSDGDGVQDSKDGCPTVAGLAKYNGCPIPDTDKDGFNDEVDKCPTVASSTNNGCPEIKQEDKKKIEMAAQGINFETGSAVIKPASFANLDKIVAILKSEPTYLVDIEGHTDNVGKSEKNLELSQKRADACKQYLIDKGIQESRISSVGYGDMKPIGDNATAAGRAKNRRTEFNIRNY